MDPGTACRDPRSAAPGHLNDTTNHNSGQLCFHHWSCDFITHANLDINPMTSKKMSKPCDKHLPCQKGAHKHSRDNLKALKTQ